jgi:hypothetical protein
MGKHSPTPWTIRYDPPELTSELTSLTGVAIQDAEENGIAFVGTGEGMGNAYLFAAAPDLLEACEIALIYLGDGANHTAKDRLRAAIAKARGEKNAEISSPPFAELYEYKFKPGE